MNTRSVWPLTIVLAWFACVVMVVLWIGFSLPCADLHNFEPLWCVRGTIQASVNVTLLVSIPAFSIASFAAERFNIRGGHRTRAAAIGVHCAFIFCAAIVEAFSVNWLGMHLLPSVLGGDEGIGIVMLLALNAGWVILTTPIFVFVLARTKPRAGEADGVVPAA